jgi:Protein of unknown function (DUF2815)
MPDENPSVILEEVTILYPHVFEPRVAKGSASDAPPTYQLVVLLPADYDLGPLNRIALAAAEKMFGSDAKKLIAAGAIKSPFRSQAEKAAEGKMGYSEDPNAKFINVKSEMQPGVVDQQLRPILDPSKIHGGVVCNVQVNAFPWSHPTGGKGLSFGLQNVQLVRDGLNLGSGNPDPKKVFRPLSVPEEGRKVDENIKSLFG